ncbi:CvpA family protein [Piscinibacter koreensis]|uniref:CvpA family protein n=1 Tax=Piscinibacter koreensis TaxID=2742824 RepID=A0A7Y6TWB5_9BURK|nr:CvpA family protein [Schlegelella koreensis]NUZ05826.1 CvpA family protein [Schlegelella koreensis]
MNLVDILLVVLVVFGVWGGWRRGFLLGAADLIALLGSAAFAFWAYPPLAGFIEAQGARWGVWLAPAAFLIAFLVARLALGLLLGALIRRVPAKAHPHVLNRALGVLPGAAQGLINAAIVALLLLALPFSDEITEHVAQSRLAQQLVEPAGWVEEQLTPIFEPAFSRTLTRLTVQPGSRESLQLPFSVKNAKPRPDLEAAMLVLVNQERRQNGLPELQADPEATPVARAHSADMFARSYFSHLTPDGKDPFDRMRAAGLRFRAAGENLALARSLPMAHQGLMNSPGHRANILQRRFGRVGIGILDGGRHGLMVTQTFRN